MLFILSHISLTGKSIPLLVSLSPPRTSRLVPRYGRQSSFKNSVLTNLITSSETINAHQSASEVESPERLPREEYSINTFPVFVAFKSFFTSMVRFSKMSASSFSPSCPTSRSCRKSLLYFTSFFVSLVCWLRNSSEAQRSLFADSDHK